VLTLTKKTDYALIALAYLARRRGGVVSARELATMSRVPLPILTNVLKALAHKGMVVSERGSMGGYALAKPATAINLHELIVTIEGPFQFVQCTLGPEESHRSDCELIPCCPIRTPAHRIHGRLKEFLQGVTLAELVEEHDEPAHSPAVPLREPIHLKHTTVREFAR